jgi:hypothetical protein
MDRPNIPRRALESKFKDTRYMEEPRTKWLTQVLKKKKA